MIKLKRNSSHCNELDGMMISVVTTLYQSEEYIREFLDRIELAIGNCIGTHGGYEIILVDDGSPDRSLELCIEEIHERKNIKLIELSRNVGHHNAMLEGLSHAIGDLVFLIDIDLEEEPELLTVFYKVMQASGSDVVYGVQDRRKGNWMERWLGAVFYRLFNLLGDLKIPDSSSTARLMVRSYVDALTSYTETDVFIGGLWYLTGFRQACVPIVKRNTSPTTYTFRKKLGLAAEALFSFSSKPLYILFFFSLSVAAIMISIAVGLVIRYVLGVETLTGWSSLMAMSAVSASLLFVCNSIFALYLAKIYNEAKRRPRAFTRKIYY